MVYGLRRTVYGVGYREETRLDEIGARREVAACVIVPMKEKTFRKQAQAHGVRL